MDLPTLALTVAFRRSGWQWPLGTGDVLRVWTAENGQPVEIPADLLMDLIRHHLAGVALQARMAAQATPASAKPMLPSPAIPPPSPRLQATRGRRLRGRPEGD